MHKINFEMTEISEKAQAVNKEAVANAATSINNVPAREYKMENQHKTGEVPADEEQDSSSKHRGQEQNPLMKERVVHRLNKRILKKVLIINSNRKIASQIKAKQKSCREHGMLVNAVFGDATAAYDAGYVLVNPITGKLVESREETFGMLVIMEGNTRFWAWLAEVERIKEEKRKSKGKGDSKTEKPFEYTFVYRHITNPKELKDKYRHINLDNVPTRTEDLAHDVVDTEKENATVVAYASKINRGLSPKGAGFATKGKEVKKKDIEALMGGKVPGIFDDGHSDDLETYQTVFEGVCEGFGIAKDARIKNKVLKGTFIWRWVANKMNATNEADDDCRFDVADKVIKMFTGMSAQDSERINNAEKTEAQTREQVIHGILDEMYNSNK